VGVSAAAARGGAPGDAPVLAAEGVRRRYGGRWVLDGASLALDRGEVLAVLGPNGAGKSTLFRLLLLLEAPDAGTIRIAGAPARAGDRRAAARLAGVFQRPVLFSGTVRSNVEYGLRARGVAGGARRARVAELLELLGIAALARVPVGELSGGEAQRVALARALAVRPDALLLDEPTANLDVTARRRFREELAGLARSGAGAALVITHDPADAFALADRVAVLQEGRVVQVGTPDDLVLRPATPFVAAFTGAELLLEGRLEGVDDGLATVALAAGGRIVGVAAETGSEAGSGAAAGPPPGAWRAGAPVQVAYRPEDVLLAAPGAGPELSARNHFRVRVEAVTPAGGLLRVRLAGEAPLAALVTRSGAAALGAEPGAAVTAHVKASALRVFLGAERTKSISAPVLER
jgi:molybdate transport system ATP-binding protein